MTPLLSALTRNIFARYQSIFTDSFVLFYHRYILKSKSRFALSPAEANGRVNITRGFQLKRNYTPLHIKKRQKNKVILIVVAVSLIAFIALTTALLLKQYSAGDTSQNPPVITGDVAAPIHNGYGIAAGSSLTGADSATINTKLDGMVALGVKWVRLDFDWSVIQPNNSHSFNWSQYDTIVAAAQKRHLYLLGILTYTPAWARPSSCQDDAKCAPADPDQFAAFSSAVASRYASQDVHYWEIWNEPNNPSFWQPKADPVAYTTLLKKAYAAIKLGDPKSYVITAGLSPQATSDNSYAPRDFLAAVYSNGGKGYFDAVADHPYTFPLSPTNTADHAWNQMAATTQSLRQIMVSNGDSNKKIWITEFGAPTGGPGAVSTISNPNLDQHPYVVDEALQKKILTDALTLYKSYDWTGPFFWYSYQDAGNTADTNENFFGLLRYDGTPKPAYDAYKAWISANEQ